MELFPRRDKHTPTGYEDTQDCVFALSESHRSSLDQSSDRTVERIESVVEQFSER